MSETYTCPWCHGRGGWEEAAPDTYEPYWVDCERCEGVGWIAKEKGDE